MSLKVRNVSRMKKGLSRLAMLFAMFACVRTSLAYVSNWNDRPEFAVRLEDGFRTGIPFIDAFKVPLGGVIGREIALGDLLPYGDRVSVIHAPFPEKLVPGQREFTVIRGTASGPWQLQRITARELQDGTCRATSFTAEVQGVGYRTKACLDAFLVRLTSLLDVAFGPHEGSGDRRSWLFGKDGRMFRLEAELVCCKSEYDERYTCLLTCALVDSQAESSLTPHIYVEDKDSDSALAELRLVTEIGVCEAETWGEMEVHVMRSYVFTNEAAKAVEKLHSQDRHNVEQAEAFRSNFWQIVREAVETDDVRSCLASRTAFDALRADPEFLARVDRRRRSELALGAALALRDSGPREEWVRQTACGLAEEYARAGEFNRWNMQKIFPEIKERRLDALPLLIQPAEVPQDADWVTRSFPVEQASEMNKVGYYDWVDDKVGYGLQNGYYKIVIVLPSSITNETLLTVGELSVKARGPSVCSFLLEKGVDYKFNAVPISNDIGWYVTDDLAGPLLGGSQNRESRRQDQRRFRDR